MHTGEDVEKHRENDSENNSKKCKHCKNNGTANRSVGKRRRDVVGWLQSTGGALSVAAHVD